MCGGGGERNVLNAGLDFGPIRTPAAFRGFRSSFTAAKKHITKKKPQNADATSCDDISLLPNSFTSYTETLQLIRVGRVSTRPKTAAD